MKLHIYSLISTDTDKINTEMVEKLGCFGENILDIDVVSNSKPSKIITNDTISPVIYSILPCPNGWSGSGFFAAIRVPISVITDEPASVKLFTASAVTEIAPVISPAINLNEHKIKFITMPNTPAKVP